MIEKVLNSELAGTWYTENPAQLSAEIKNYLEAIDLEPLDNVMALLLPHAGYRYSGMVAAHGIKLLEGRSFSRVIVIGPSHQVALIDTVSIPDVSHIETPLGRIEIDRDLVGHLLENPAFQSYTRAHQGEHSVQIELPFLQQELGDFKLVPIICGELSEANVRKIAATLLENIDAETLIIISSDFTHYGSSFNYVPFKKEISQNLKKLDMGAFRWIEQKNLTGFLQYIQNTKVTICGRSPIAILLAMLPDAAQVKLLKYETSANLTGDWSQSVSYISAAISGHWTNATSPGLKLSDADKIGLLRLARHRISKELNAQIPDQALEITPPMQVVMGGFVTLHKQGQLRGCIGEIFPRRALHEVIKEHAVSAAFHDPRFPRLRANELDEINIEISALTVPHRIHSYQEIRIGQHGIVLSKKGRTAVFLPQVASEQGWGIEETLAHLAQKAGLASNDWESGCEFKVFEAIVFGEI